MKLKTVIPVTNVKSLPKARRVQAKEIYDCFSKANLYLVDGELYAGEDDSELLLHWSHIAIGDDVKHEPFPMVRTNGEYVFQIVRTADYETSAISLSDGKSFVVHDG